MSIDSIANGGFSSYNDCQFFSGNFCDADKEKAISLLFGNNVTDEQKGKIKSFMEKRYKKNHSLALLITDAERKRSIFGQSEFTQLCNELGLDPGHREVQVTDKGVLLYSDKYAVPSKVV